MKIEEHVGWCDAVVYTHECPECGKIFVLEVHTEIAYTSKRRIEDMPKGWCGDD